MYRRCFAFTNYNGATFGIQASRWRNIGVWVDGQNMRSPYMRIYGSSLPPIGHIRFCRTFPNDCTPQKSKAGTLFHVSRQVE